MNTAYDQIVTRTFRDDAIRSVSIIDDDAYSYKKIVDKSKVLSDLLAGIKEKFASIDGDSVTAKSLLDEVVAIDLLDLDKLAPVSEICEFFQKNKIICDVDSVAENLDHDKIRKSDLIILDYHLLHEDSTASRNLILKLSNTPHMNMVVVYTSHTLSDAWKESALTLRGSKEVDLNGEHFDLWQELCGDDFYPLQWGARVEEGDIECIIKNNELTKATSDFIIEILNSAGVDENNHAWFISAFIESYLRYARNVVSNFSNRKLMASNGDVKWIQAGNVFVTFYQKNEVDDLKAEPEAIWARLNDALVDWSPSYYRVVLSEIQNRLEDQGLPMDVLVGKDIYEQASILWNILPRINSGQVDESVDGTINNIYEYLNKAALSDSLLRGFIVEVVKALSQLGVANKDDVLKIALKNCDKAKTTINNDDHHYITHAFNKELSSIEILPEYITTGTILKSIVGAKVGATEGATEGVTVGATDEEAEWYLCVSPSCNTVPGQGKKKSLSDRIKPHKVLRFIKLYECDLSKALKSASKSNTLFITDGGRRIGLQAVDNNFPEIELGVVLYHNNKDLKINGFKEVNFFQESSAQNITPMDTKKLIAVAQLRDIYAARFQNIQSHYEGRIGVDFVSLLN